MSVPAQYTDAHDRLMTFRELIFKDLISGRVKASLDASHAGMQKYNGLVKNLVVAPYMFNKVRERALVLKLSGQSVGAGEIHQAKAVYNLDTVEYPLKVPFAVGRRNLPQVDIFEYTPVFEYDMLKSGNEEMIKSMFLIQVESGTFANKPDVENAIYDFYQLIPILKRRLRWDISAYNPKQDIWDIAEGEELILYRALWPTGTMNELGYEIGVIIEPTLFTNTTYKETGAFLLRIHGPESGPVPYLNVGGQREKFEHRSVWWVPIKEGGTCGFWRVADDAGLSSLDVTWKNHFTLTFRISPVGAGTVDGKIDGDTEVFAAWDSKTYTKTAVPPYIFDYWELDSVKVGTGATFYFQANKDATLKAVFK